MSTENYIARIAAVADEALNIAERKGLTLGEILWLPDAIRNKIIYEMKQQDMPYKRGKPQT